MPSTLVAYVLKNAGCLVGMRGMGPEWKYKCKPYFIFRRENQLVHFSGKGAAWHTWFSSCSTVLVILHKERILFFMHNFLCWIGNALWSYFISLYYFISFEPLKLNWPCIFSFSLSSPAGWISPIHWGPSSTCPCNRLYLVQPAGSETQVL